MNEGFDISKPINVRRARFFAAHPFEQQLRSTAVKLAAAWGETPAKAFAGWTAVKDGRPRAGLLIVRADVSLDRLAAALPPACHIRATRVTEATEVIIAGPDMPVVPPDGMPERVSLTLIRTHYPDRCLVHSRFLRDADAAWLGEEWELGSWATEDEMNAFLATWRAP